MVLSPFLLRDLSQCGFLVYADQSVCLDSLVVENLRCGCFPRCSILVGAPLGRAAFVPLPIPFESNKEDRSCCLDLLSKRIHPFHSKRVRSFDTIPETIPDILFKRDLGLWLRWRHTLICDRHQQVQKSLSK